MRKEIVRSKQSLDDKAVKQILDKAQFGVLALNGDDGYLYSIPLSYVWANGAVYFHGRPKGYKFDSMQRTKKTSFAIVAQSHVVPKLRANNFRSVIVWGVLEPVTNLEEKRAALTALADKYSPGVADNQAEIEHSLEYVFSAKLVPEAITGKEALDEVINEGTSNPDIAAPTSLLMP